MARRATGVPNSSVSGVGVVSTTTEAEDAADGARSSGSMLVPSPSRRPAFPLATDSPVPNSPPAPRRRAKRAVNNEDVVGFLSRQEPSVLVGLIVAEMRSNADFKRRMTLHVAVEQGGADKTGPNMATLRKMLTAAIPVGRNVGRKAAKSHLKRLDEIVTIMEELRDERVDGDHAMARSLFELAGYGIDRLESAINQIDDPGDSAHDLFVRLVELHQELVGEAAPEPRAFAAYFLDRILHANIESYSARISAYAQALGFDWLAELRRLTEEEWAKVPVREPSFGWSGHYSMSGAIHGRITSLMEQFARNDNDVDGLIRVMSRDLSGIHRFLAIAQILQRGGRHDEALEWAERGDQLFAPANDFRLRPFLLEEYRRLGRADDVLQILRSAFARSPSLESYTPVIQHLRENGLLDSVESERRAMIARISGDGSMAGRRVVLEIYLAENDLDRAWEEAANSLTPIPLLEALAQRLAVARPTDALAIYRRVLPGLIERSGGDYGSAMAVLATMRTLYDRLDRGADWIAFVAEIRDVFGRRRSLLNEMQARGL